MNPNKLVQFLGKHPDEFTKRDIMRFIEIEKLIEEYLHCS